jgi:hypothetical protein
MTEVAGLPGHFVFGHGFPALPVIARLDQAIQ